MKPLNMFWMIFLLLWQLFLSGINLLLKWLPCQVSLCIDNCKKIPSETKPNLNVYRSSVAFQLSSLQEVRNNCILWVSKQFSVQCDFNVYLIYCCNFENHFNKLQLSSRYYISQKKIKYLHTREICCICQNG